MHMAVKLITFSSLRLNLINSANGHSKSHSFYFPKESVHWNPPAIMSQMTVEHRVTAGMPWRRLITSLPQSKHTSKSSHSNLKAICACRPTSSQQQKHKMLSKDKFILSELISSCYRAAIESCEKQLHRLQGIWAYRLIKVILGTPTGLPNAHCGPYFDASGENHIMYNMFT